jgi:hypothetical protein
VGNRLSSIGADRYFFTTFLITKDGKSGIQKKGWEEIPRQESDKENNETLP